MKTKWFGAKERAFTAIDILVVVVTIALFAIVIIPAAFVRPKTGGARINCVSNLKQIGLGLRMFSNDHEEKFPWNVLSAKSGASEKVSTGDPTLQFLTMTNELISARVLACPSDKAVTRVANFAGLSRTNISYFLCLEGDESTPNNLVSGDRNITGGFYSNRFYWLPVQGGKAGWGTNLHQLAGNIGLSDGSAQQVMVGGLNSQLQRMSNETVRLLLP
jgi:competence protein ComGC